MAALAAQLKESSAMTPVEREAKKSRREKAEDIAYTINHAISCGITDLWIQVPISSWVAQKADKSKFFSTLTHFFEKHETGEANAVKPKEPTAADVKMVLNPKRGAGKGLLTKLNANQPENAEGKNFAKAVQEQHAREHSWFSHFRQWLVGEALGDFGAVPLTIMVQRFLPGVMDGIRKVVEPIAGSIYRKGAEHSARQWATKQGFDAYGEEAYTKAAEIYEHEVSHLPQALVWNAFSIPINIAIQKGMKSQSSIASLLVGKTFGSIVSNGVLLGGRAVAPQTFGKWDDFNTRNLIMPVSKVVGSVFGVDNDTMDRVGREHEHNGRPGSKISGTRYDTRLQEHTAALATPSHG